jgi:hypothetical protein
MWLLAPGIEALFFFLFSFFDTKRATLSSKCIKIIKKATVLMLGEPRRLPDRWLVGGRLTGTYSEGFSTCDLDINILGFPLSSSKC